jgi:hypothetical protein
MITAWSALDDTFIAFGNEKYFDAIIKHTRFLEVFRDLWYVFFTSQLVKTQGKSLFSYFSAFHRPIQN